MVDTPRIPLTVIIPAFGNQAELNRALASISAQAAWPREVIVVDDGSRPVLALPPLPAGFPASLIRHDENSGAAAARNTGLRASRTQWVSFLDSDDWLIPGTLSKRWEFVAARQAVRPDAKVVYACGWHEVQPDGGQIGTRLPRQSDSLEDFASGCWFSPGSCIIVHAGEALREAGAQDETLRRFEDFDWFLNLGLHGFVLRVHPLIGASVTRRRSVPPVVAESASLNISRKWRHKGLPMRLRRRIGAYLALETAAANYYAGRRLRAASHLLRSFFLVPRLTLQFSPGWDRADPHESADLPDGI